MFHNIVCLLQNNVNKAYLSFLRKARQLLAHDCSTMYLVKENIFSEYLSRINFVFFLFFAVTSSIISHKHIMCHVTLIIHEVPAWNGHNSHISPALQLCNTNIADKPSLNKCGPGREKQQ